MQAWIASALTLAAATGLAAEATISIEHDHLIVEVAPFALRITEIATIRIEGDGALAAHGFHWAAPPGAQNVRLLQGQGPGADAFEVADGAVRNRSELAAGRHQVQLQYDLVDASSTVRLLLPRSYPTSAVDILLPSTAVQARAAGLESVGVFEVEGRSFQQLKGSNIPAGQPIELILTRPIAPERRHDATALWLMTALAGLTALGVLRSILVARSQGGAAAPH